MPSPKSFTLDQFAARGVQVSPRWQTEPQLRQQLAGRWRVNSDGYVERSETGGGKTLLHRLVKGLAIHDPITVEHDNHNRLDNRDENLLLKTRAENAKGRKDPIPGLRQDTERGQWFLRPTVQGERLFLGRFHSRDDAARRFDCFVRHGQRCECWKRPGAGAGKVPATPVAQPKPAQPKPAQHICSPAEAIAILAQARASQPRYTPPRPSPSPPVEPAVRPELSPEHEARLREEATLFDLARGVHETAQEREQRWWEERQAREGVASPTAQIIPFRSAK
jgi:hypothetical protein